MLTEEAIRDIRIAKTIYGSDRAIEIAQPFISPACVVRTIDDFKALHQLPEDAVVLSTGDPMLAGLGYLQGTVIPGVSSLQVAAARLHIPLARVSVVVAHGRGHEQGMSETLAEVQRGKIVYFLADPKFDVGELYRRLSALDCRPIRIAACENLGYPDEHIDVGEIDLPPVPNADLYSLVIGKFWFFCRSYSVCRGWPDNKAFFLPDLIVKWGMSFPMDKATKTQLSVMFFVIGLAMIFMQDLKRLDTINLGFSMPFAIMFYIGLIFMVIGYYLK
jgi:cobalt-precorrin-7 (C5)-methyltransferase